tara:strand:- start:2230 stop:3174 length:945 start_codon:yes stop_codon:yes gene_type:complete
MNKLISFLIIFLSIFLYSNNIFASQKIKILYKIDNSLITNIDINNELNYLISLNKKLEDLNKSEKIEIAKESLIREKIKSNEIKKYFIVEKYENNQLIQDIIKSLYTNLNLSNLIEFENYLETFGISINEVKEKLKIEILWNQLISRKFQNQIIIDENTIRQNVKNDKMNYKEVIEYDLSEIVLAPQNEKEFNETIKKVLETINMHGFETAATKFSISDTSRIGGNIGKIKENQLSKELKKEIQKLKVNDFSKPIFINNNYLIIKVNQKKIINEEFDENKIVKEIIRIEKDKQYQNFSQIYYNKIKLNSQINEF